MFLLSGNSLTPAKKIPMQSLSVTLKERESVATMVPLDMNGIYYNSWFLDEAYPNGGTVWRVKSITQAYNTHTPTVQLEHVIYLLKDRLMFGEIKPGDMAGNANATTCTAEQAIRYILSYQEDWVLGDFGYAGVSNPYKFNGDSLFDALETVTKSLKNAWWVCDTTVYPFRLSIIQKNNDVFSEMRCGRNIKTISRTVDKSGMYTRFYPIGKDDLHIDGDYIEMNSYQYGIIAKVDTDTSIDSKDELRRWAIEQLEIHSEPVITIEVDGFELADATGEPLDKLTLGRICRVPLPEYGTTITERIVSIQYPDKVRQPQVAKVTLSNSKTDVMKVIAEEFKKNKGGGRAAAKQQEEDHAYMIDTKDKVGMVAKSIVGSGPGAWERISSLIVDGEGIHAKVERNEQGLVTAFTQIDMNEQRILLEADRAISSENNLNAKITVQADRITQEVTNRISGQTELGSRITQTATRIDQEVYARIQGETQLGSRITQMANLIDLEVQRATAAEGSLSGRITVEAGKITQIVSAVGKDGQVTAASICLAINNGGSTATINAGKIYLLGQTIANTIDADYIKAKIANIPILSAQAIALSGGLSSSSGDIRTGGTVGGASLYLGSQNMDEAIISATVSGNTLTLKNVKGDTVTFNKAVTPTGAWSGGTVTVSASGNSWYSTLKTLAAGDITWSGNSGTFNVMAYNNGAEVPISTGRQMTVDASARFNAGRVDGWEDCWDLFTLNYSSDQTIAPGGQITIYPRGKPTPTAEMQQKTSEGITITASGGSAPTSTGIYDTNSAVVQSQTLSRGSSIDLWGGTYYEGAWIWGSKVTITAQGNPSYNYSLKCTDVVNNGGIITNTFQTTGSGFSKGSSYGFWRA